VKNRLKKYYGKNSVVIHPPIDLKKFNNKLKDKPGSYYLSFGAITPYKKIDLIVKTFNKNKLPLLIVGEGSEKKKLEKIANSNIIFKGKVEDDELDNIIYNAKALIFPGEEDFGMIPLEVMAQGVPVIAYGRGGSLETVVENKEMISHSSGIFFYEQSETSLNEAVNYFSVIEMQFNPNWIRDHARKFGEDHFQKKFSKTVKEFLNGDLSVG
jgi:glycosyltransferase involved in cell wall biosynthesis